MATHTDNANTCGFSPEYIDALKQANAHPEKLA